MKEQAEWRTNLYNKKRTHIRTQITPLAKLLDEPKKAAKKLEEPKQQIAETYGLDKAYDAKHYISTIDSTLYVVGKKIGRASYWYVDITKVPTLWSDVLIIHLYNFLMCAMKALPYIGYLARKADRASQFGIFGDLATSSRYSIGEKALSENPIRKRSSRR